MKIFENTIKQVLIQTINDLYHQTVDEKNIQISQTRKEFTGDFTIVVFPFVKFSATSPEATAQQIGETMLKKTDILSAFNVVKGFLNLSVSQHAWFLFFQTIKTSDFHFFKPENQAPCVVEFSSPNTNKPLHLGHVRNNLLGSAICNILENNGFNVKRVNLVNDRGIHICKSMVAWLKLGNGETPASSGMKGDKLVGKYYVAFDRCYKEEIQQLIQSGKTEDEAKQEAPILLAAQDMLRKWENGDKEVRDLWQQMNEWVYEGFEQTYNRLGIHFDKIYYESETYLLGKDIVAQGLANNIFYRHQDGSVRIDLTQDGLDEKILLRKDGTSVYMTQDLGTASLRAKEFAPQKMIYVVGNEQNYHFEVLKLILDKKLGFEWGKNIFHLSYGMVELPNGKMKSREGTVVDADDLMQEMYEVAKQNTTELGKIDQFSPQEAQQLFEMIGLGALKYFILKVDPKKNMLFNPDESVDLNGNTAPFIQYTHARICSLLQKAQEQNMDIDQNLNCEIPAAELELLKNIYDYRNVLYQAGEDLNPALIANYTYNLVKQYNQFYQSNKILKCEDNELRILRLQLSHLIAKLIAHAMNLLGIDVPEKM